jgi:transposase
MSAHKKKKKGGKADEFHVDESELQALSERIAQRKIEDGDWDTLSRYLALVLKLSAALQFGRIKMKRITRILFGKRTEKEKKKDPPEDPKPPVSSEDVSHNASDTGKQQKADDASIDEGSSEKTGKGHGRRSVNEFQNTATVVCRHGHHKPGDICPDCESGRLYAMAAAIIIRFTGNPPITGTKYEQEKMRCNTCGSIIKADLPEGVSNEKYDASAKVSIVMNKYGMGTPFYRLGMQQAQQLIPLAPSVQWELAEDAANGYLPVYLEFKRLVAQADLIFIDDTPYRILADGKKQPLTGIVARIGAQWITLYLSGPEAAGKKLAEILKLRPPYLPPPLQMSDALSGNQQDLVQVTVLLCMVHCRRQFFEIKDFYPEVCEPVLEAIRLVYRNEKDIRDLHLDAADRLAYHQTHSLPLLERMRAWLQQQSDQHLIEPNSPLGKAVRYLNKHWDGLTGFCRYAGAPLDSNVVERALKMTISNRKNSYFFKTGHGADVGCLLMSMIRTATQSAISPFAYLETLLRHRKELRQNPALWMPWNYQTQAP